MLYPVGAALVTESFHPIVYFCRSSGLSGSQSLLHVAY